MFSDRALQALRDSRCAGDVLHLPDVVSIDVHVELDVALRASGAAWDDGAYRFLRDASDIAAAMLRERRAVPAPAPVVLSYGMGVESTAILLRWLEEPDCRDFDLRDLLVVTAQTGDEFRDLGPLLDAHVLPRMRKHGVRWAQVARSGPLQADGVAVLEDSRAPQKVHLSGAYKLSDELTAAGTVPQVASGKRRCSLKAKGWPLDTWIEGTLKGRPFRHVMGFNAGETRRVLRDQSYSSLTRSSEYPLVEWGWDRAACEEYILRVTGARWPKSCCSYCPFAHKVDGEDMRAHLDRFRADPQAGADALILEHVSVTLNPRMTLYATRSLLEVVQDTEGMEGVLSAYEERLRHLPWAVYRVRRIYHAPGRADRQTTILHAGLSKDRAEALARENESWMERGDAYPTREEFVVACPALPDEKARPGFDQKWASLEKIC